MFQQVSLGAHRETLKILKYENLKRLGMSKLESCTIRTFAIENLMIMNCLIQDRFHFSQKLRFKCQS